jgi:hypothetical protein
MNKLDNSLSALLERFEYEAETADGRTVRVCRDSAGDFWVVDGSERIVSLHDYAAECHSAAWMVGARGRAETVSRIAARTKEALARVANSLQRLGARVARA